MNIQPVGANQTELTINDNLIIFFSYKTPVACVKRSEISGLLEKYKTNQFYSKTTVKHINNWLINHGLNLSTGKAIEKEQSFFDDLIK